MSWFFNSDFEDYLKSSQNSYSVQSNKKNQEFEYFILWLEDESLFSLKKYDEQYLEFINRFNTNKVTTKKENLKLWCCEVTDKEKQRLSNSKIETSKFGIEHALCHQSTEIIQEVEQYKDGYLYKEAFGVSGSGNYTYSEQRKINLPLVKEKILERTFDFSTLIIGDKVEIYQNHIDNYYQYRGTTIGLNFEYFDWIDDYKKSIELIKNKFQIDNLPMSIDSFLYEENNAEKCYVLSEVNNRKTMGYTAHKLKEKLFPKYRYSKLSLVPTKKSKNKLSQEEIYKFFDEKIILLSPVDTFFSTFMIAEDSLGELNELEDLLFSTFFIDL